MDYFSQLQNLGGLASQYQADLQLRNSEMTSNAEQETSYADAFSAFSSISAEDAKAGIDELKAWGAQSGGEIALGIANKLYQGSGLQKSANALWDTGASYVKQKASSAFQSLQEGGDEALQGIQDFGNVLSQGAQGIAKDFASTSFTNAPMRTSFNTRGEQPDESGVELSEEIGAAPRAANPNIAETNIDEPNMIAQPDGAEAGQAFADSSPDEMYNPAYEGQLAGFDDNLDADMSQLGNGNIGGASGRVWSSNEAVEADPEGDIQSGGRFLPSQSTSTAEAPVGDVASVEEAGTENLGIEGENTAAVGKYEGELAETGEAAAEDVGVSAGADIGEEIGADAIEDTATAGTGIGEVLLVGQLLEAGGKALYDWIDPKKPPAPPQMPTLTQVIQLPSYIQASAQSGV